MFGLILDSSFFLNTFFFQLGFIRSTVWRRDQGNQLIRNESAQNGDRRTVGRNIRQIWTDRAKEHSARQNHWQTARCRFHSVSVCV